MILMSLQVDIATSSNRKFRINNRPKNIIPPVKSRSLLISSVPTAISDLAGSSVRLLHWKRNVDLKAYNSSFIHRLPSDVSSRRDK